jgi:hypothetical protein
MTFSEPETKKKDKEALFDGILHSLNEIERQQKLGKSIL